MEFGMFQSRSASAGNEFLYVPEDFSEQLRGDPGVHTDNAG